MNNPPQNWQTYEEALRTLAADGAPYEVAPLILKLRKLFPSANPNDLNLAVETYVGRRALHWYRATLDRLIFLCGFRLLCG